MMAVLTKTVVAPRLRCDGGIIEMFCTLLSMTVNAATWLSRRVLTQCWHCVGCVKIGRCACFIHKHKSLGDPTPESRVVRRALVTLADGDGPSSGTSTAALCVDALAKQLH